MALYVCVVNFESSACLLGMHQCNQYFYAFSSALDRVRPEFVHTVKLASKMKAKMGTKQDINQPGLTLCSVGRVLFILV